MFTLTRLAAALMMMGFMLWLAPRYDTLLDPEREALGLTRLMGTVGFIVGWSFLGGGARALWLSVYMGVQAVALSGIVAALLAAVRDIFLLGYQRRFGDAIEALLAIPQIAWGYLRLALDPPFLTVLVVGGVVLGLAVHVLDRALDKRRLDR